MRCRFNRWTRRTLQRLVLLSATLAGPILATAEPLEVALWPLPGIVNVVDGKPTDGLTIEGFKLLLTHLPDLQPEYRLANRLRQQYLMEQGHNFCSMPLLRRADTDEFGYFIPFMASTPIQAVVRRSDLERFPLEDGDLSLERLLNDTTLRAGKSGFRTYPPTIEAWLQKASAQGRAEVVTGSQSGENLLLMVSHGRIDLVFELASISLALTKGLRMPESLVTLPVKEDRKLFQTGIYCTRNAWGHAMAQRLDLAVRALAAEPAALLALYAKGMPDETWPAFSGAMADYYRQRAETPTRFDLPR